MKHRLNAAQSDKPSRNDNDEPSRFVSSALMVLLAVAAFSAIGPATAAPQGTIYRCADARGSVSYQDTACAPDLRTTAVRRYTAYTIDPALSAHRREIEQEMDRRNRITATIVRIAPIRQKPKTPSRCEAAKIKRESVLQRVGLKRNFALMSELDGGVWDACKGL